MTTPTMEQRRADFEDMLKHAARDIITTVAEVMSAS